MSDNKIINKAKIKGSGPTAKLIITLIIAVLLLIPVSAISNLVRERENRKESAVFEVTNQWGAASI